MPGASISRRALLARCFLVLLPTLARAQGAPSSAARKIRDLEAGSGARIGVAALDIGTGRTILHREDERFLFCSTWKFLVVTALLARVDRGEENLSRVVRIFKEDLVPHAPVAAQHLADGMTLAALCHAAMTVSDNTAANLLLTAVGGVEQFNQFLRSLGDATTTLARNEPGLNVPYGAKDTSTPRAMLGDLKRILLGDALQPASRQQIRAWLAANTTGDTLLRAGLPKHWIVGDKTGRGSGATNDIAIATASAGRPMLIAAYTMLRPGRIASPTLLADIGRIVGETFGA